MGVATGGLGSHLHEFVAAWEFDEAIDVFCLEAKGAGLADAREEGDIKELIDGIGKIEAVEDCAGGQINHAQTAAAAGDAFCVEALF
jgi:hypothetical protein